MKAKNTWKNCRLERNKINENKFRGKEKLNGVRDQKRQKQLEINGRKVTKCHPKKIKKFWESIN